MRTALTLPSGARVTLSAKKEAARERKEGAPLFSEVLAVFDDGTVTIDAGDPRELSLSDFHVVRAVLTKWGVVAEKDIEITCANCGTAIDVRPCAALEIGPYVHGEIDDPELDRLLAPGVAHDIPPVVLGRVREAKTVTFARRTVREVLPLFEALGKDRLDVTADVVRGLGIQALGRERDPEKIARALAECEEPAFSAVTDLFLATHYPLRLGAFTFCGECKARNDVDAPYEREFAHSGDRRPLGGDEGEPVVRDRAPLPSFDAFAEVAHRIAKPLLAEIPGEPVELVIDGGTPAVDDGGEPLLGSYVPPHPGDIASPTRPPTVTLYYKTFEAVEKDEPGWDWAAELEETIEHELEHHVYFLRGEDPMDEEERAEIDREALRIVGRKEASRRALTDFAASLRDFAVRTWPLWLIALLALAFSLAQR